MKTKLNITLLCLFFACQDSIITECDYIKDYYPYTSKAEIEFYSGNYQKAFELYQEAFKNCDPINIGTHNDTGKFARICAELGKNDLALSFIEMRIENGGIMSEFEHDSIFVKLLKTPRGEKTISNYQDKRKEFISSINLNLRAKIQKMIELDQKYNSTKHQDSIFQINDKKLVEIFENYGYPNEQLIGAYNIDQISADPTILLLHTNDSIRLNYFIPKVREFVKNGKCPPYILGTMYDNLELFNNQPQVFGTYQNSKGGYAYMISDMSKVNANRLNIGLPTLEMTIKIDSLKQL